MQNLTNEQLMVGYAESVDPRYFDELYQRHSQRLIHFLEGYMFNEDHEDVAQMVWSNVHEYRHQFNPDFKFTTWFYTMAVKKVAQFAAKGAPTTHLGALEGFEPSYVPVDLSETESEVRRAVRTLPEDQRRVIDAKYFQGLRACDVVTVLEANRMTLHRIEKRALRNLQRELCDVA